MTTNQTIDGVPRELLEAFAAYVADSPNAIMRARAKELRALLDAPYPPAKCHCAPLCYLSDSSCPVHGKPAAQPQGEPVSMALKYLARVLDEDQFNTVEDMLYAEQPAPVADPLAKGFTTLESDSGKYKIVTSFATRDDAWSAYRALLGAKPASVAVQLLERFADYAESGKVAEPSMAEALRSYLNTK